jgi:hypothetical protein
MSYEKAERLKQIKIDLETAKEELRLAEARRESAHRRFLLAENGRDLMIEVVTLIQHKLDGEEINGQTDSTEG